MTWELMDRFAAEWRPEAKMLQRHPHLRFDAKYPRLTIFYRSRTTQIRRSGSQIVYNNTDYYSLLGKIALQEGKGREAMNDLEKAMRRDLDTADKMFNIWEVEPEKTSQPCVWNLTDLHGLIASFPKEYLP